MNEKSKERMLDLLTDQVLFGLNAEESAELKELEGLYPELKDDASFELTASAIGINSLEKIEPMPNHLRSKILADADNFFKTEDNSNKVLNFQPKLREVSAIKENEEPAKVIEFIKPTRQSWNWLGWAVAAAACIALALNLWFTGFQKPKDIADVKPTPQILTVLQQRDQLLNSNPDIIKANWTDANPKQPVGISGDVVWSSKEQKGFLRLRGLPKNDANKETYQLWIFDANQDDKTPVDGGIFDVNENGEVIIPINAKLKVAKPQMFAVTVEKPGGVVVSKREKLLSIAKVQA